ncbi:hypothetical protein GCM10010228_09590 [Streptomyces massasporeus]|nr:hypothetical protein GCM10010228_09590 [Streptomyces massasporeus]
MGVVTKTWSSAIAEMPRMMPRIPASMSITAAKIIRPAAAVPCLVLEVPCVGCVAVILLLDSAASGAVSDRRWGYRRPRRPMLRSR